VTDKDGRGLEFCKILVVLAIFIEIEAVMVFTRNHQKLRYLPLR